MRTDLYTKFVLTIIAALLAALALRPVPVKAQPDSGDIYIEPGYTTLRKPDGTAQLKGKMVVDLTTGDVWGFPTLVDGPYPIDPAHSTPPVSDPMYLGKFNFGAMKR